MHLQEIHYLTLTLWIKVKQKLPQYPPHHMTHAPAKFKVATSNSLGGYAFTRNTLFEIDLAVKVI